jgi:hypothetical protein
MRKGVGDLGVTGRVRCVPGVIAELPTQVSADDVAILAAPQRASVGL